LKNKGFFELHFNQFNKSSCKTFSAVHWLNKDVLDLGLIVESNEAKGRVFIYKSNDAFRVDDIIP